MPKHQSMSVRRQGTMIKIKPEILKKAKMGASNQNMDFSEFMENVIMSWIKNRKKQDHAQGLIKETRKCAICKVGTIHVKPTSIRKTCTPKCSREYKKQMVQIAKNNRSYKKKRYEYNLKYNKKPDVIARKKMLAKKPENIAKRKAMRNTPQYKAKRKAYRTTPENMTREKIRREIPKNKAKAKERSKQQQLKKSLDVKNRSN